MRTLVISSHKGTRNETENLHWKNARIISERLGADFIWSHPSVNDFISEDYDRIVFVHASHYSYTDYEWIRRSPNASLFYVVNEYNLGEPRTLWMAVKQGGRRYKVIANHPPAPSKIVKRNVDDWINVNLNALCYKRMDVDAHGRAGNVYYGSFRKDRIDYFKRCLVDGVIVSTHSKNIPKFMNEGIRARFIRRLNISAGDLSLFGASIYIEDKTTHEHYNYLANRFYESISWGTPVVFDESCMGTVEKSGYCGATFSRSFPFNDELEIPEEWHDMAQKEKSNALSEIVEAIEAG